MIRFPVIGILIIGLAILTSCEKIVNIDLNTVNQKFVIQGNLYNLNDSIPSVLLSQTASFYSDSAIPMVTSGAVVFIKDSSLNTRSMTYSLQQGKIPGYYFNTFFGKPGHTYYFTVVYQNQTYIASSYMPDTVPLDSLSSKITLRQSLFGRSSDQRYTFSYYFKDPSGIQLHYYRTKSFITATYQSNYIIDTVIHTNGTKVFSDENSQGLEITGTFGNVDLKIKINGDSIPLTSVSVIFELLSCDKGVYDYYNTLKNAVSVNALSGTTPANPISNISNGALGYFAAYSVSVRSLNINLP